MKKYYPIKMELLRYRKLWFLKGRLEIVITLPYERLDEANKLADKIRKFFVKKGE